MDLLEKFFHHDLGEGHLENYIQKINPKTVDLDQTHKTGWSVAYFSPVLNTTKKVYFSSVTFNEKPLYGFSLYSTQHNRRGPPSLI